VRLLPQSGLVRLANVGHMPQIEDVDAFNAALFAFLDSQR
jgi:pimeloyl-ACP methyl ester carboxylesterase